MTKESFIEEYKEGGICALVEGDIDYATVPGQFGRQIRSIVGQLKKNVDKLEQLINDEEYKAELVTEEPFEEDEEYEDDE